MLKARNNRMLPRSPLTRGETTLHHGGVRWRLFDIDAVPKRVHGVVALIGQVNGGYHVLELLGTGLVRTIAAERARPRAAEWSRSSPDANLLIGVTAPETLTTRRRLGPGR